MLVPRRAQEVEPSWNMTMLCVDRPVLMASRARLASSNGVLVRSTNTSPAELTALNMLWLSVEGVTVMVTGIALLPLLLMRDG
jgi:hypothetical protein